jgi:PilZ domain
MDKRPETRVPADIPVRAYGMDAEGKPFFEKAVASNLSSEGAQLTRVQHSLKIGEVIGIQYGDKKARFEIKWVKPGFLPNTVEAGLFLLSGQTVPWSEETSESQKGPRVVARGSDKRKYTRHKVNFPLTLSFAGSGRSHMQCAATDIGGRGCYVESLVPLPIGSELMITFWVDSEKFTTKGIIRASDPGVGMGIEFTELPGQVQQKLQQYLETIDKGFASSAGQGS